MSKRIDLKAAPRRTPEVVDGAEGPRCPFCHDAIAVEGRVWLACEGCLARHHLGCWRSAGRCGTCREERAVGPVSGARARELEAAGRRHRWESLLTIVVLVAAAAGALGWLLGRWWVPPSPPDLAPALRISLQVARVERARAASALLLLRLGREDLADRVLAWDTLDERGRHDLRYALGRFLRAEQDRPSSDERRIRCLELEAELPLAIDAS